MTTTMESTRPDPRTLMARAKAGDTAAFGQLYTALRPEVYAVARARFPQHAEDITHDVFARAFAARHRWHDQGVSPAAWLRTITINLCTDRARSAYTTRVQLREPANLDRPDEAFDPALVAAKYAVSREVLTALKALSAGRQEAIILHHLHRLSTAQTAQTMGVSVAAVKMLLVRGRREMRKALTEVGRG